MVALLMVSQQIFYKDWLTTVENSSKKYKTVGDNMVQAMRRAPKQTKGRPIEKGEKQPIQVRLDSDIFDAIAQRARREGRSPSNLCAFLLSQSLDLETAPVEIERELLSGSMERGCGQADKPKGTPHRL
jgi:hypothetical protein